MKTVAVLQATIALFSDKNNWSSGQLKARVGGQYCFCALGGIIKSGGLYEERDWDYGDGGVYLQTKPNAELDSTNGFVGIHLNGKIVRAEDFGKLSRAVINEYASRGAHILAVANAQRYLQAAVNKLAGRNISITTANDSCMNGFGYDFIMKALKLAVRNATRRHINGDWSKTTKRPSRRAPAAAILRGAQ